MNIINLHPSMPNACTAAFSRNSVSYVEDSNMGNITTINNIWSWAPQIQLYFWAHHAPFVVLWLSTSSKYFWHSLTDWFYSLTSNWRISIFPVSYKSQHPFVHHRQWSHLHGPTKTTSMAASSLSPLVVIDNPPLLGTPQIVEVNTNHLVTPTTKNLCPKVSYWVSSLNILSSPWFLRSHWTCVPPPAFNKDFSLHKFYDTVENISALDFFCKLADS